MGLILGRAPPFLGGFTLLFTNDFLLNNTLVRNFVLFGPSGLSLWIYFEGRRPEEEQYGPKGHIAILSWPEGPAVTFIFFE